MPIETKSNMPKESYFTAGLGAAAGGCIAKGAIDHRLSSISKKTFSALKNPNKSECDAFVAKHNGFITKALESKKGFFGKINQAILKNQDSSKESVACYTDKILQGYTQKAQKKAPVKLSGEKFDKAVEKLSEKYMKKDILKSFKNVTRQENILKISLAAIMGLFTACTIKQLAIRHYEKEAEMKK